MKGYTELGLHDPEGRFSEALRAFALDAHRAILAAAQQHLGHPINFAAIVDLKPNSGSREMQTAVLTNLPSAQIAYGLMLGHILAHDEGVATSVGVRTSK